MLEKKENFFFKEENLFFVYVKTQNPSNLQKLIHIKFSYKKYRNLFSKDTEEIRQEIKAK